MPAPPKKLKLRLRYDTRQRIIIDRCAQVFAERGYHGTSIDDLIAATGLTRGGLYHYIGSKAELLTRILDDLMGPLLEEAAEVVHRPGSAEERLRALTLVWMEQVESHQDHIVVFLQERRTIEQGATWDAVRRDREAFESLLTDVLRQGVATGEFALADPGLSALALLGMVNHSAVWFRPDGRLTAEQVANGFCDLLLHGVTPR